VWLWLRDNTRASFNANTVSGPHRSTQPAMQRGPPSPRAPFQARSSKPETNSKSQAPNQTQPGVANVPNRKTSAHRLDLAILETATLVRAHRVSVCRVAISCRGGRVVFFLLDFTIVSDFEFRILDSANFNGSAPPPSPRADEEQCESGAGRGRASLRRGFGLPISKRRSVRPVLERDLVPGARTQVGEPNLPAMGRFELA
jgi:hypothetical protein